MKAPYLTPQKTHQCEIEIKKSRFITRLCPASSRQEAFDALAQAKTDFPDARHHCWAYQIGPPQQPDLVAMSDDGEPSGTAGKPILNVVQHKDVGNIMLIVIRYFGGIKLGAGGLVRAYSAAAQSAYSEATFVEVIARETLLVHCTFSDEQSVRHWTAIHQGEVLSADYQHKVTLKLCIPAEALAPLRSFCEGLKGCSLNIDSA